MMVFSQHAYRVVSNGSILRYLPYQLIKTILVCMNQSLKEKLISIAKEVSAKRDCSHDFNHVIRVTKLAEIIAETENADVEVIVPAALFHDAIVYKKNSVESKNEADESAAYAAKQLEQISGYPAEKIEKVQQCIRECSFSKGIVPKSLESKILQDADRLEATGAIAIMRTFASCENMNIQFYEPSDPFCKKGAVPFRSGLDLFYNRLLLVEDGMHTSFARKIAERRTLFLKNFLEELNLELIESKVI